MKKIILFTALIIIPCLFIFGIKITNGAEIKNIILVSPKDNEIITKDIFYTFKWEPNFGNLKLQGTNILAEIYFVREKDGAEIPLSSGLIFDQSHWEREVYLPIKPADYSKENLSSGRYRVAVKFFDLTSAKPCGVVDSLDSPPCAYREEINYGIIAEAKSKGFVTVVDKMSKDALIEGRTYSVKELNTNASTAARKFFTEAYAKGFSCPNGSICQGVAFLDLSDTLSTEIRTKSPIISSPMEGIISIKPDYEINSGDELNSYYMKLFKTFKIESGKRYRFEVSAKNMSDTNTTQNQFTIVSVKNIDGSAVASATTSPQVTDNQMANKNFFQRLWTWFAELF